MMQTTEHAFFLAAGSYQLPVILHYGLPNARRGLVLMPGGPQYRVGPYRQFVSLARELAANGVPVLRFDFPGRGDSPRQTSDPIELEKPVSVAVDAIFDHCQDLEAVVLAGFCSSAPLGVHHAAFDKRICGVILVNPWLLSERTRARKALQFYAGATLNKEAWGRVLSGEVKGRKAAQRVAQHARRFILGTATKGQQREVDPMLVFADSVNDRLSRFSGRIQLILSGRDDIASEFIKRTTSDPIWERLSLEGRLERHDIPEADHTFSKRTWRDQVNQWILNWLTSM